MKSLLIFSDTPFYHVNNTVAVFEPTLKEIELISDLFDSITWISYRRGGQAPENSRPPSISNIRLITLPDFRGGFFFFSKMKVLITLPYQVFVFLREQKRIQIIHARGPSVPAFIVLLYSFFDRKKVIWYKYAGNWAETKLPAAYRLQRWLLMKQRKKNLYITINGKWNNLHERFFNWENPCLTEEELKKAVSVQKDFSGKWRICFVGNLAPFKGAVRLARALSDPAIREKVEGLWIIGNGEEWDQLIQLRRNLPYPLHLTGNMPRSEIFSSIYSLCHFLALPSKSEGFPKVVAEAAAHKCIPIVSAVSALDQYIYHGKNGFLFRDFSVGGIIGTFSRDILVKTPQELEAIAGKAAGLGKLFTYEEYHHKVKSIILG